MKALLIPILLWLTPHADAHCYSIWKYPTPQRCGVHAAQYKLPPSPPQPPFKVVEPQPQFDIPLPSLEGMEFPPDCLAEWCQRLKGVGMLREKLGTD